VPPSIGIERKVSSRRLLAVGLTTASLLGLAGGAFELRRFGRSDAAAAARVEAHVSAELAAMAASLARVAGEVATNRETAPALANPADEARRLFDVVAAARATVGQDEDLAVTLYDTRGDARAWVGRSSDIPVASQRVGGPAAFFLAPSRVGLRLVHIEPVTRPDGSRAGTVAAEHVLSPAGPGATIRATDYILPTPLVPVSLRTRWEGAGEQPRAGAFLLRTPSGEPLAEATVSLDDLREARTRFRRQIAAAVLIAAGVTFLLLIGPLLDRRARARDGSLILRLTVRAALLVMLGSALIWSGVAWAVYAIPRPAVSLLVLGGAAASVVALAAGPVSRLAIRYRGKRLSPGNRPVLFLGSQLLAGTGVALLVLLFAYLINRAVEPLSVDLRSFSLYPWNGSRLLLVGGILALHLAVLWAATLVLAAAPAVWRLPRRLGRESLLLALLWLIPAGIVAALATAQGRAFSASGLLISAAACALAALLGRRVTPWYRHATVAARILTLFLAFLIPTLLLYPSVHFFARRATERLITRRFAVEAQQHPHAIQHRMTEARAEIDALTFLPELVSDAASTVRADTDSAFLVWRETVLARARLTSSVELYNRDGSLVSRFALNLPEYTGAAQKPQPASACDWDLFGEGAPFGSEERSMLHAERNICVENAGSNDAAIAGTIVVHVAFDYRALPFISSQDPYFEVFRPTDEDAPAETAPGGDVDVAIYGWGLRPIYTSDRTAWPITDELFQRIYKSRDSFWTTIPRGDEMWRVYFSNDRWRIFAIGYPRLTAFDHLVHLAELTTLAGACFVLVLIGTAFFTRASRERPRTGRALLREIRASFYRKLFLAFVLASIIPVLTLAVVIRAYFAKLLRDDVQAAASRTAAVAQRVIESSDSLLRRGPDGMVSISDDVMIWISQVIDQDVNIFEGPRLLATSERDLFASGLLPTRTPDKVYRAIAIERLSGFVDEDAIGTFPYMIAAAPVRATGQDWILTVPLTLRQREIERDIAELDRGVHLAALFFVLLGAGIGLSLAERIADPVRRLTLATRRIARGDFDARIAVRSADELKRLVDAFNSMAEELKAQRGQLERTHRLEAWAEMARQVAHEIKNPLTPIQLSAEHLRRVHADRGEPMGPVLESCVSSILGQVRLLRQISGEFSSFASAPTVKRAPANVADLVEEVVHPYRTPLADRITIDNRVSSGVPRVLVDRSLITRALANIVENALHAMPGNGTLTIDAEADGSFVMVRIRDTGVGMDEESLARVFEPYFSTKTTGTGLGLPIALRNVEASGGTIDVESVKGQGTVVRMKLPVA
jgi:signal transduction histidine kinase/MFS family permease